MRFSEGEARQIIGEELARVGWDTASSLTVEDAARPNAESLSWWNENTPPNETSETPRSIGYLRAYLRIAGDTLLYAEGLRLSRGRLWMDRSIMSRFERDGYLEFVGGADPHFALTPKGYLLLTDDQPHVAARARERLE